MNIPMNQLEVSIKNNKENGQNFDSSIFISPIFELLNLAILKLVEFAPKIFNVLFNLVTNKEMFLKDRSLKRKSLEIKKTTTKFDSIGYSINRREELKGEDINKKMHGVVIGASGSGKSVLLETLMFEDMRSDKAVIFIDPKADYEGMQRFIDFCKLNNRRHLIFSETYKGEDKIRLNPAKDGSYTQIADRIFKSFSWSEEYYANKSYQVLKLAIKLLMEKEAQINLEVILEKIKELTTLSKSNPHFADINAVDGIITKLSNIVDTDFGAYLKGTDAKSFRELRESN